VPLGKHLVAYTSWGMVIIDDAHLCFHAVAGIDLLFIADSALIPFLFASKLLVLIRAFV
jgi:hypothetical protein